MDTGILILRLGVGTLLAAHAAQKLFGWFHGPGPAGAQVLFAKIGLQPARPMVLIASAFEIAAALLLTLGLMSPLGSAIAAGTMIVAGCSLILVSHTFWNTGGGGEYPLVLALVSLGIGFTGPGRYSLDHTFDLPWSNPDTGNAVATGFLVLLVAAAAAAPPVMVARRTLSRRAQIRDPAAGPSPT